MSTIPENLKYTKDHEWTRVEGNRATVGITDHAQQQLTDVVYVELPAVGKVVKAGDVLGTVESVKAVSEIFSPLSGKVVEVNHTLEDAPEIVNEDPYTKGWIVVLEISDPGEVKGLMDAAAYTKHVGG
ncbi:MAG: glycine cleavage system protein GcvH [Candidatus Thermoplasmatota archaeon]